MRAHGLSAVLALGALSGCNAVLGLDELQGPGEDATTDAADVAEEVLGDAADASVVDDAADAADTAETADDTAIGDTALGDAADGADTADTADTRLADASDAADTAIADASDAADAADTADAPVVDPCAGIACNMPPAAGCTSSTTRRTYAATGTCSAGSCTYAQTDAACSNQACVSGACVGSCSPGATRCSANTPQTCDATGTWQGATACVSQTCVSGICQGSCAPGDTRCTSTAVQGCSATGAWATSVDLTAPKWTQTYGTAADEQSYFPGALTTTADGNFEIVGTTIPVGGGTTKGYLTKFGPTGTKLFERAYANGAIYSVIPVADGTIAIGQAGKPVLGCTANRSCGYVVRVGLDGTMAWEKAYNPAGGDIQDFYGIAPSPSGFVIVGNTTDTNPYLDPLARSFDLAGTAGWTKSFSQNREDNLTQVRLAPDGTYYAAGGIGGWSACQQPYVVHFDASGNKKGEFGLGPCINDSTASGNRNYGQGVLPLTDGSVIVVGYLYNATSDSLDGFAAKIANLDTTPTEVWRRVYGGAGDQTLLGSELLADGGFLFVGSTAPGRFAAKGGSVYVVRTDSAGNELWHQSYGGSGDEGGTSVVRAPDGSYVVGGWTDSTGAGGKDFYAFNIPAVCPALASAPSCVGGGDGLTNCGPAANESCCASLTVPGIASPTFSRSYDGVSTGYLDASFKAQVSDFKLDKFEITVGRFRRYVAAVVTGWKPPAGSGKHTHLPGGGLNAGTEPGWDASWNTAANFPTASATWDGTGYLTHPTCGAYASWTGGNERRPINCIDWYDAAAFCIWDGGFLPSEAEWNYAAAGGTEQRKYPWPASSGEPAANANLAIYGCYSNGTGTCTGVTNLAPVGSAPLGNGKYGQSDLAGNAREWTLDWYKTPYNETTCTNCSYLVASSNRVIRGGDFYDAATYLLAGYRYVDGTPSRRTPGIGARCARIAP